MQVPGFILDREENEVTPCNKAAESPWCLGWGRHRATVDVSIGLAVSTWTSQSELRASGTQTRIDFMCSGVFCWHPGFSWDQFRHLLPSLWPKPDTDHGHYAWYRVWCGTQAHRPSKPMRLNGHTFFRAIKKGRFSLTANEIVRWTECLCLVKI